MLSLIPASYIRQDLVTFLECDSGVSGKVLADKMLGFVPTYFDPSKLHGQTYDGTSNVYGNGVGASLCIHLLCRLAVPPTV